MIGWMVPHRGRNVKGHGVGLVALALLLTPGTLRAQTANGGPAAYGYDPGAVAVATKPSSASHSAGQAVGCAACAGLQGAIFSVPLGRPQTSVPGGNGLLQNVLWKSVGGDTSGKLIRIWQKFPSNTTCQDGTAFSGSDIDDASLITAPLAFTPSAPGNTTGDSATYAALNNLALDFHNSDAPFTQNLYACVITTGTDTGDENATVRLTFSGPGN